MASALSDLGVPAAAESGTSADAQLSAQAAVPSSAFTLADYTIWGVDGDAVSSSDFNYNASAKTITINTDKRFAIQNTDQAKVATGDNIGRIANPSDICFVIPSGRKVYMVFEGIGIKGAEPIDINPGGELTLVLGDDSINELVCNKNWNSVIHCPAGSKLTIDDSVLNRKADGTHLVPEKGLVPEDCTLENGRTVHKGDPLSKLESSKPGSLIVTNISSAEGAAIGGKYYGITETASNYCKGDAGGTMTFDGGTIEVKNGGNVSAGTINTAAGIGGGHMGNGTGPNDWITVNGGRIKTTAACHGAGIGAAWGAASGNICINGGFVESGGGSHSTGFGGACMAQDSSQFQIVLTGGTLIPTGAGGVFDDVGAPGLQVTVTGSSLGNNKGAAGFRFSGTAKNDKGEPVRMVEIDLTGDVGANAYAITEWQLLVDGVPYDYGAPAEFDKGHLYLWLPERVVLESEVTVDLTYLNTDKLDPDGNPTEVTPDALFRPPGESTDGKLRRYEDFALPPEAEAALTKPYDGLPLAGFDLAACPIETKEDGKYLDDPSAVAYRYQPYDRRGGAPLGPEVDDAGHLPTDEGVAKFVMTSTQYSDDTESGFSESYWGHRATGWCEITPVASRVAGVTAKWADGSDVADAQLPEKVLDVEVDVTSGDGTAATCKAPTGKVQLYVDGEPVGDPVAIDLGAGGNAAVRADADGREHTVVSWSFPAGELMAPGARHKISARYIPAINYLESADPAEGDVPESEVAVRPDPKIAPALKLEKSVENLTHPQGPTQPGDRLRYTVTAANSAAGSLWTDVVLTDALPKCLELDASTLHLENDWEGFSGAPVAGDGKTEGTWALSAPGADGRRTLSVGAGAVAGGSSAVLTFECTVSEPDFASASEGDLDLANTAEADGTRPDPADPDNPMPDPDDPGKPLPVAPSPTGPVTPPGGDKVAPSDPDVRVSKAVENITSPGAKMTKGGDTLRYEIVLENRGPASSCLLNAVVSDPLPAGIEPVAGTLRLTLADGTDVAVPDSAYDSASRTVAVTAGDLWGGQRVALTFDAVVGEAALGTDAANIADAHGTVPSEEPGDGSQPEDPEPGLPAPVPPAGDDPVASSDPAVPPVIVGDDPEEGDLSISKEAENLTRQDGTTRVGDTVRYAIILKNNGPATSWMDAAIRDDVPEGLEPIAGTIRMVLPDGAELEVSDDAYDHRTRVLAVAAGSLHGGQAVTLAFDALVTEAALSDDIGNTALAYGQPPSRWDPDGEHPEPGTPFDPPEGWEEYGRTREVIESPAAYPPGVTRDGGVLPADGPVDDSATISRTRLAQTGDALGRLAGTLAGAAAGSLLVAGALALATRRRARTAR
ncbi:hypothetical protein [uncultured Adlercreutzia sp.]|uniref:hypothetical protein n=1 Tax=uncultured Adlercreutzia sp. TaxID=875803 RepID=UPI0025DD2E06|nr:hypothetical protein [uncultured Adlercreutzia sp.]